MYQLQQSMLGHPNVQKHLKMDSWTHFLVSKFADTLWLKEEHLYQ